MATFAYIARDSRGERVRGVLTAETEQAAARQLGERQLFPVQLSEQADEAGGGGGERASTRAVAAVYGQMGDLLRAGVPMLRTLTTLQRVLGDRTLKRIMQRVEHDVSEGGTLADAMAAHPRAFLPLHTAMIRAGEKGGFLEEVLSNLSTFLERQDELRSKLLGAMIYPAIVTSAALLLLAAALGIFVPSFKSFFSNATDLPWITRTLFAVSDLFTQRLPVLVASGVLLGLAGYAAWRSEGGQAAWQRWRLKLPVVGPTIQMVAVTRFCRILGTLLANGVPLLAALQIARDAAGSRPLAEAINGAVEAVRAGQPLTDPLRHSGVMPTEIVEMIAVAEESNQLDHVLLQVADTVEKRTNRRIDTAVSLIGPLILIPLALGVLVMAIAILFPIFNMGQALAS